MRHAMMYRFFIMQAVTAYFVGTHRTIDQQTGFTIALALVKQLVNQSPPGREHDALIVALLPGAAIG